MVGDDEKEKDIFQMKNNEIGGGAKNTCTIYNIQKRIEPKDFKR